MHGEQCSVAETQFLSIPQSTDKPHAVHLVLLGKFCLLSLPLLKNHNTNSRLS